ncbi:MAG: hypothetical protein R2883_01510 [Caldisericia bacterium]
MKSSEIRIQANKEMVFKVDTSSEPEPVEQKKEREDDSGHTRKTGLNSVTVRMNGRKNVVVAPAK